MGSTPQSGRPITDPERRRMMVCCLRHCLDGPCLFLTVLLGESYRRPLSPGELVRELGEACGLTAAGICNVVNALVGSGLAWQDYRGLWPVIPDEDDPVFSDDDIEEIG